MFPDLMDPAYILNSGNLWSWECTQRDLRTLVTEIVHTVSLLWSWSLEDFDRKSYFSTLKKKMIKIQT